MGDAAWARRAMAGTGYWAPENVLQLLLAAYMVWCVAPSGLREQASAPELTNNLCARAACADAPHRLKETESDQALYKRKVKHQETLLQFIAFVGVGALWPLRARPANAAMRAPFAAVDNAGNWCGTPTFPARSRRASAPARPRCPPSAAYVAACSASVRPVHGRAPNSGLCVIPIWCPVSQILRDAESALTVVLRYDDSYPVTTALAYCHIVSVIAETLNHDRRDRMAYGACGVLVPP